MNILFDKIVSLELSNQEKDAQVLEICALLNTAESIAPQLKTNYKLKPVLIPHLIEEGIMEPNKLQAIANHPICVDFLKAVIKDHYNGALELSPTIEQLVAAGRTFMILTEADAQAVRDRLDVAKVVEADKLKSLSEQRYESWVEEVPQPPISWSQTNLGRSVNGDEVLQILGAIYGDNEKGD